MENYENYENQIEETVEETKGGNGLLIAGAVLGGAVIGFVGSKLFDNYQLKRYVKKQKELENQQSQQLLQNCNGDDQIVEAGNSSDLEVVK